MHASPLPPSAHQAPQPTYNVYASNCPARMVLDRLADKWALLVIGRLRDGPVRFNQLRRNVEGVSQKVLSQTLKKLERDGLVLRCVIGSTPVTVEYSLTPLGWTLAELIESLSAWAESNIEAVLHAQQAYDAQHHNPLSEQGSTPS
ncbi:winged helix-turn-helix transcriptional regulator [Uliginosibacterium gangwonense]|uniref:winged helix-turn-helix transcriptional regulator n=1 Tax=Uliginosibacterium gangwonense TaxID=392736 RepID=UPI00036E6D47|nr:helix-turn-helix domain-containing protein [Uliginosibacterium gangwonense]